MIPELLFLMLAVWDNNASLQCEYFLLSVLNRVKSNLLHYVVYLDTYFFKYF